MLPEEQLLHARERLAWCGLAPALGGALSILDDKGDLWMVPSILAEPGGPPGAAAPPVRVNQASGSGALPGAQALHQAIYAARRDVRAIVHGRSPALAAFSLARQQTDMRLIPQARRVCGQVGHVTGGKPGEDSALLLAEGIDVALGDDQSVVSTGPDLLTAFQRVETLDLIARIQLQARRLGAVHVLTDEQITTAEACAPALPTFRPGEPDSHEQALRREMCRTMRRANEQRLMTSVEGTLSARVADGQRAGSLLITPAIADRQLLEAGDLVLIQDGAVEQGKAPSRALRLHQAVYAAQPTIRCVISAQPPHAMAFGVTGQVLDSRAMSEAHVILGRVQLVPYGRQYDALEEVAAAISRSSPVLLIENDALLTTGGSIQQAYDRLEVADFTALALLGAQTIGAPVPIGELELRALAAEVG